MCRFEKTCLLTCLCLWLAFGAANPATAQKADAFYTQRLKMVAEFIEAEGITNKRVLEAMRTVPRHEFVTQATRAHAYEDMALPIGNRQTISPPFIVAYMTEAIDPQPGDRVLEIGTGSGYQAAVLVRTGEGGLHDRNRRAAGQSRPQPGSRVWATRT